MNCKQGDLAYVVVPGRPADGMIVKCVEFLGVIAITCQGGVEKLPVWRLDHPIPAFDGTPTTKASDDRLRPIRPQSDDKVDEMLLIAGKPKEVTV